MKKYGNESTLEERKANASKERSRALGYSTCAHCGLPWSVVSPWMHMFPDGYRGFFFVCEPCWLYLVNLAHGSILLVILLLARYNRDWRSSEESMMDYFEVVNKDYWEAKKQR